MCLLWFKIINIKRYLITRSYSPRGKNADFTRHKWEKPSNYSYSCLICELWMMAVKLNCSNYCICLWKWTLKNASLAIFWFCNQTIKMWPLSGVFASCGSKSVVTAVLRCCFAVDFSALNEINGQLTNISFLSLQNCFWFFSLCYPSTHLFYLFSALSQLPFWI